MPPKYTLVTPEMVQEVATKIKAKGHVECSAMTQDGVKNVFDAAIRCVLAPAPTPAASSRKMCTIM
jgi:GTPase SAR1 family protein